MRTARASRETCAKRCDGTRFRRRITIFRHIVISVAATSAATALSAI